MVSISNSQCIQSSNSSNLQTFKLSNLQTLNISNIRTPNPSKFQTFEVWKLQTFNRPKFETFRTFKFRSFQTFKLPGSQTFKLEPEGCSVNLRLASSCNVRCRGFKLQSWIPLQTFKLQTRARFQTRNSQTFKLQTCHFPNFSNFQTLQSCPTCNTFKLSKIRVRKTPLVTPLKLSSAWIEDWSEHRSSTWDRQPGITWCCDLVVRSTGFVRILTSEGLRSGVHVSDFLHLHARVRVGGGFRCRCSSLRLKVVCCLSTVSCKSAALTPGRTWVTWVGRLCPSSRQRSDDYRISFAAHLFD